MTPNEVTASPPVRSRPTRGRAGQRLAGLLILAMFAVAGWLTGPLVNLDRETLARQVPVVPLTDPGAGETLDLHLGARLVIPRSGQVDPEDIRILPVLSRVPLTVDPRAGTFTPEGGSPRALPPDERLVLVGPGGGVQVLELPPIPVFRQWLRELCLQSARQREGSRQPLPPRFRPAAVLRELRLTIPDFPPGFLPDPPARS